MMSLLLLLIGGLALLAIIPLARYAESRVWRARLMAYELHVPSGLSVDQVANWLNTVQATTHAAQYSLLPLPPVGLELVATSSGIHFYLFVVRQSADKILAGLRASLPGVRIEELPQASIVARPTFQVAAELTMTNHSRPLAYERAEQSARSLLASLSPVVENSEIHIQWLMVSAGTPKPIPSSAVAANDAHPLHSGNSGLFQDSDAVRAARMKQASPLLHASCRIGVVAPNRAMAYALLGRVWGNYHALNAPGVRIVRRWLPTRIVAKRLTNRTLPLIHWPLLLSTREAVGLVGLPIGDIHLPGLTLSSSRQLPPARHMPKVGQVIALSNYVGTMGQPLALTAEDRTRHTYIVGPSGSGKTVLLTNMILNDIASGHGVFACDPKGGLIHNVLARLDDAARERIIVLDASKRDHPIGLNILGGATSEAGRELVVDSVLHAFREIWSAFWGPRTDSILRAALSSLAAVPAMDGSTMTICEITPLLTNPSFRRYVTTHPKLPPQFRDYWQRFNNLSENEMAQHIGPVLNKVEAFTQRTAIRLMLGQSKGISFEQLFRERKVVLVNLAKGELGSETGNLLGALIISELWRATLGQVRVEPTHRPFAFAYIDEAQDIVRLPLSMADMLAQAREFKLGLCLANQYLAQLPETVRAAVLGTVKTQIAFAVEHDDARLLAQRFAPLTADELMGLPAFELAMRPCVGAQTLVPVTGVSLPLDEPRLDPQEVAAQSRGTYGVERAVVEAALHSRMQAPARRAGGFGMEAAS